MTTKQILNDCYELVTTKTCGSKVVNVYRATTMQELPKSLIEDYADPLQLCPDKPFKGFRLDAASRGCAEWDAQVVLAVHGSIVDMYVCAILMSSCSKEAERYYVNLTGKKASERVGMMWDSRNFDREVKPKKKRIRPTLKQVRMLEAERNDLKQSLDIAIGQCADKDKTIKALEKDLGEALKQNDCLVSKEKYDSVRVERDTLEKSNKLMEAELKRVKEKLAVAEKGWQEGKDEVARLMNRGFWARVFNR